MDFETSSTTLSEAAWSGGPIGSLEYRDFGVEKASKGLMSLEHLKASGPNATQVDTTREIHDLDVWWQFVLRGSVTFESEDGQTSTLNERDSVIIPRGLGFRRFDFSPDFEAIEMRCSPPESDAAGESTDPGQEPARALYLQDRTEDYVKGAGPREIFHYRDLGLADFTDGRMHVHVLECREDMPLEGTRWHYHSMAQWFWVLQGEGACSVEGGEFKRKLLAGDGGTIGRGPECRHDFWVGAGYAIVECCIPAEYDTITVPTPDGWPDDFRYLVD
jgi:quercetin dioxygenase-like cupin family protein